MRLRVLWVVPALPRRGVSGTQEYLRALAERLGGLHDITMIAAVDPAAPRGGADEPAGLVALDRVPMAWWQAPDPLFMLPRTVQCGFTNPTLRRVVQERLRGTKWDLLCWDYPEVGLSLPGAAVPSVLTVHTLWWVSELEVVRALGGLRQRVLGVHRHLRALDFELRTVLRATRVVTLTHEDAARLRRFLPTLPLDVIPAGIDLDHFRPSTCPPEPTTDLLFVGSFQFVANVDAVRFLVRDVLPQVGRRVRLRVVGSGIDPEVRRSVPDGIEWVSDAPDVRPHLEEAAVVVAPVRIGTGMRIKVLEALAMARPLVATSRGVEGTGVERGLHCEVADDAPGFAVAVRRLLDDRERARALGRAARRHLEAHLGWDRLAAEWDACWRAVAASGGTTAPPRYDAPPSARAIGRAGRCPGVAVGTVVLALRGFRWWAPALLRSHQRRSERQRPPRGGWTDGGRTGMP